MDTINGGLIALAASTITLVITQLFEFLKSGKAHDNELRKMYFEKKLNAAELMFSQLATLKSSFLHLIIVYDRQIEQDPIALIDVGEEMVDENLLETSKKYLNLAQDSVYNIANAAALYFDFDEPSKNGLKLLHDEFGKSQAKQNAVFEANDRLRISVESNANIEQARAVFEEKKLDFRNQQMRISAICDELYKTLSRQSEIIRNAMRKFE